VQQIHFEIVSLMLCDKNETFKVATQLKKKILSDWHNVAWNVRPFAATQQWRRQRHCLTAMSITCWSKCSHLSKLRHILDFPAVNRLLSYFL